MLYQYKKIKFLKTETSLSNAVIIIGEKQNRHLIFYSKKRIFQD